MKLNVLKTTASILTLMMTLILGCTAVEQSGDPPTPEPIILTDEQGEYQLGLHLALLEDPSGVLTIEDVAAPEFNSQFTPNQVAVPNIGFTESAIWARVNIQNESRITDQWLLQVAFANIHYVDIYTPLPDDQGYSVKQTGIARPPETRDIFHPHFVFNMTVPTESQQTVYLRIQSGTSTILPLKLWTPAAFIIDSQRLQAFHILLFGALISLLIYNLFLLFSLREASYLYLVMIIASLVVFDAAYAGYLDLYIIPQLYHLRLYYVALSFAMIFVSMVLFANNFLEVKTQLPKLHRLNIAILAVWGALILLIPFARYYVVAILMLPWGLVSLVAVLTAGIITSWRRFRPARFYIIAWFGLIATFTLILLVRLGFLPSTIFIENAYRLGWVWMAVCWSLALADRINLLKAETEAANLDLRNSEHRLSQTLGGLPIGVVVYGKDQRPTYVNQRTAKILSNPDQDIQVDISVGRTLEQAIGYFSMKKIGTNQAYPLERMPIYRALQGEPASVDDIEADLVDRRVPLEIWASPVRDEAGQIESAVVAFQDISQRKQAETELIEHRKNLELLVANRTAELNTLNQQLQAEISERKHLESMLQMRLEWLTAISLVNQVMARSADFTEIYQKIIEIINDLFYSEDSFIAELDEGGKRLKILAHSCRSDRHPELLGSVSPLTATIHSNPDIKQGHLAIFSREQLNTLSGSIGLHFQGTPIHTIILVPLILRERVIGFLGVELHDEKREITTEETTLLNIFSFDIARLIEDSRLFKQTKALITEQERNRLARDLHDSVTQVLFSATLLAEVLPKIWQRDPKQGLQRLDKLRRLTRGALAEMRTMLLELRPAAVINTPLGELLAQLTEAITSRSGLPFQLFIEQIPPLPDDVQTSFYRIAQEALNNVVKHAQAKRVSVSLSARPLTPSSNGAARHEVKLVIEDDGVGFSQQEDMTDHLGLSIMRERAAAIQAKLSLDSKLGYGTRMTLICCQETRSQE